MLTHHIQTRIVHPDSSIFFMKKKIVVEIISSLLISLFLFASLSQWLDFKTFTDNINNQPIPNKFTPLITWGIPSLEILIVAALIFERTRLKGLQASLLLLLSFTIYIVLILLNAFDWIPCSCSGVIKTMTWNQHLIFNLFFIVVALIGILLKKNSFHHTTSAPRTMLS